MKHRDKILELRKQGKSYNQIANELGCAKSTVCFHCGNGQKIKTYINRKRFKLNQHPYLDKLYRFYSSKYNIHDTNSIKSNLQKQFNNKLRDFWKRGNKMDNKITLEQVINKFGENPKCYLTGDIIDINKPRTYQFDHIIPTSRGGNNTIDNLGICTKQANMAKTNMTPDELINFCKKVLEHNGFNIERK